MSLCLGPGDKNNLLLKDSCRVCEGGFPLGIVLIGAAAAAVAGGVIVAREEKVATPSRP